MKKTPEELHDLATRVAGVFALEDAIREAYQAVLDNAPHFSDDGMDYMYAAATVYAELVGMARTSGMYESNDEYIAWLAEDPYEAWLATDGDFRWWLSGLIAEQHPDLAAEWGALEEGVYD